MTSKLDRNYNFLISYWPQLPVLRDISVLNTSKFPLLIVVILCKYSPVFRQILNVFQSTGLVAYRHSSPIQFRGDFAPDRQPYSRMEMKSSESLILSLRRYATSHIYFVFLQKSDDNSRLFVRYFLSPLHLDLKDLA